MELTINLLNSFGHVVVLGDADSMVTAIKNFFLPFILLGLSGAALAFLWQRQFMKMAAFGAIAVIVFAIWFAPQMLSNIGKNFGEQNKDLGSTTQWK